MFPTINNASKFSARTIISTKTVRNVNQKMIERGKLAKLECLTLAEYNAIHKEDFVHKNGRKTIDFYALAQELVSDKEKLKKACSDAWKKVMNK